MTRNLNFVERIHQALPQTQCQRCGYDDCAAYAHAIADEATNINRCPPGGQEGVRRLAAITGRYEAPLDAECGQEGPRQLAIIDENWCIGCTLCLQACPTDAIVGVNKAMHAVIDSECTGCELCIPVCPVDCIELVNLTDEKTGWAAWSEEQAHHALSRYGLHKKRQSNKDLRQAQKREAATLAHAQGLAEQTRPATENELARRHSIIAAALAKARAKREA